MTEERTTPSETTVDAEETEASNLHAADRAPTPDEEAAAEKAAADPAVSGDQEDVAEHYREMTERGASAEGEGKIN